MQTPENRLKSALKTHTRQLGLWLSLTDPGIAELLATTGVDFLCIDAEHAPWDLASIQAALRVLAAYPVAAMVRLPQASDALIKQVLELGAETLLIPMVESAAEAQAIVRAMRYPPAGIRGVGAPLARSGRYGALTDYLKRANEEVCLLVQIESVPGAERAAEIAAVDGVDGVLVGQGDLAASMGRLGEPYHPEVQARIERILQDVRASGKAAAIYCGDLALARRYEAAGASLIALGADVSLLAGGARTTLAQYRNG